MAVHFPPILHWTCRATTFPVKAPRKAVDDRFPGRGASNDTFARHSKVEGEEEEGEEEENLSISARHTSRLRDVETSKQASATI